MKKRILSILLILCMVLSMLPLSAFATGAANHLTVLETAPATATVAAGSLYELDLSTVFADSEGHTLTYALSGGDFGEHTKIADGKLAFTVSTAGEYKPTITATCSEGDFVSHTVTITVTEAAEGSDRQYGYDETPAASVTVYVTISNDGMPILSSNDTDTVMAGLKVTVPYFDLKLYGLEDYYRYHTEDGQGSYVDDVIVERPTALHLYIYLLERYYMGLPEKDCCKGTSGVLDYAEDTAVSYFDGTGAYSSGTLQAADFNGSATSFFMNNFWGHDLNLKYYRNHAYPLMYAGWGSTADYILLSDGDAIDIGLFSNWNFYNEGEFCCFDADAYTGEAGSTLTAKLLRWNADENDLEAFADLSVALYDSDWNKVTELTQPESGNVFTLTLPETAGEYYLLGMDLNAATEDAVNSPAVARITVTGTEPEPEEPSVQGYLSDLHFAASSGATSQLFEMSPAFTEDNLTYTMLVPDNRSGAYAWATLSENAPEGSTITAKWAGTNGQDRSITITSGKTTGQWMAYFLDAGTHVNSVTVEVGVEGDLQTYEVQVVRVQPTLTELSLEGIRFNESFSATTFAYTTATMADSVTINATPRDESYTVTYNGSESNVVALTDGENSISVKVVNEGGYESVYTITVNKVAPISIRFDVTPADAVVNLQDSFGDRIWPEDGIYTLMSGCTYSYTVTKNGYIGQKNNFTLTESGTIEIELEEAPENAAIDTTIYAQWGVFRGENNLGITDAPTPYT
ncbi:MAG: cadherin-like beta sandwich domain-containing protein, partial [Eubacteriales bacterium]